MPWRRSLLLVCVLACLAPASAAASMKMLIGAAEDEGRNTDPAVARTKMDLAKAAGFDAIRITAVWAPGQSKVDDNQLAGAVDPPGSAEVRIVGEGVDCGSDGRMDARVVPAEQALEMATIVGARALGLEGKIGSIEVGKKADLVLFETRRAEWRALVDPINNLVYSADGRSVRLVVADGRVVVDDGRVLFADEAAVADRVQGLGEALLARTNARVNRGRWPIV